MLDQKDANLVLLLAGSGGCSLDESPGTNWVEENGGLPDYICHIAKAIMGSGKTRSSAISIAVSRVKVWAAGGSKVDASTRAKAAAAVAEWEALKAKNAAGNVVKATRSDGAGYLLLSNIGSFNTQVVRDAWNDFIEDARGNASVDGYSSDSEAPSIGYQPYIVELWTDFAIICYGDDDYMKIPYTVTDGDDVEFGKPVTVEQQWIETPPEDDEDEEYSGDLSDIEAMLLGDVLSLSRGGEALQRIMRLVEKK